MSSTASYAENARLRPADRLPDFLFLQRSLTEVQVILGRHAFALRTTHHRPLVADSLFRHDTSVTIRICRAGGDIVVVLLVQEKLHEDRPVEQQCAQTACDPACVDSNVPRVDCARLSWPAASRTPLAAVFRVICEDRHVVCQVADTGEQKEEQGDAFCGFSSVVQQDLRDARGEIEDCAEVAEDLAQEVELERLGWLRVVLVVMVVVVMMLPRVVHGDVPP